MLPRALVVLAVDPGPTRWGWALLAIVWSSTGIFITWIAGDHEPWSVARALQILDRADNEARARDADVLVASEIVTGKVFAGRSDANVLDTSRECGRATPIAELLDLLRRQNRLFGGERRAAILTAEYTTAQWQMALTGYAKDVTQEVHDLCARGMVAGLPALPARHPGTNIKYAEHVHDACCIAVAAGHLARGRMSVLLPAKVAVEIARLVSKARGERARKAQANKEAKAAGIAPPKVDLRRRPRSRAERERRSLSAVLSAARRA